MERENIVREDSTSFNLRKREKISFSGELSCGSKLSNELYQRSKILISALVEKILTSTKFNNKIQLNTNSYYYYI